MKLVIGGSKGPKCFAFASSKFHQHSTFFRNRYKSGLLGAFFFLHIKSACHFTVHMSTECNPQTLDQQSVMLPWFKNMDLRHAASWFLNRNKLHHKSHPSPWTAFIKILCPACLCTAVIQKYRPNTTLFLIDPLWFLLDFSTPVLL